jgi:hypothetical protein
MKTATTLMNQLSRNLNLSLFQISIKFQLTSEEISLRVKSRLKLNKSSNIKNTFINRLHKSLKMNIKYGKI